MPDQEQKENIIRGELSLQRRKSAFDFFRRRTRDGDVFSVEPVTIRQHRTQLPPPLLKLLCVSSLSTWSTNNDRILIRIHLHRLLRRRRSLGKRHTNRQHH